MRPRLSTSSWVVEGVVETAGEEPGVEVQVDCFLVLQLLQHRVTLSLLVLVALGVKRRAIPEPTAAHRCLVRLRP
jgi:hypothetical protein